MEAGGVDALTSGGVTDRHPHPGPPPAAGGAGLGLGKSCASVRDFFQENERLRMGDPEIPRVRPSLVYFSP